MAGGLMAGQSSAHTLQATALVHEAWMRLSRLDRLELQDRRAFFALAARVMRHVLVDHARAKGRSKRDGTAPVMQLEADVADARDAGPGSDTRLDLIELGQALDRLEKLSPRQVEVFELRYLAGFEVDEVAEALGLSATTIKRESAMARAWLLRELDALHG